MAKNLFWMKIAAEYTCWLHSLSLMRKETIKFEDCHYNNYFYWPSLALDESDWEHKTFTSKLSAYYMRVEWNKFPYNWSLTCQSLAAIGNNVTVLLAMKFLGTPTKNTITHIWNQAWGTCCKELIYKFTLSSVSKKYWTYLAIRKGTEDQ